MSINGIFVVDSVVHGFDTTAANAVSRFGRGVLLSNFGFQWAMVPDPYRVEPLRYFQTTSADVLEALLFHESGVDLAVYHTVPAWGFFRDFSPMSVGLELRRRHPKRVLLYGGISPPPGEKAPGDLERQGARGGIIRLKVYPVDVVDGRPAGVRFRG